MMLVNAAAPSSPAAALFLTIPITPSASLQATPTPLVNQSPPRQNTEERKGERKSGDNKVHLKELLLPHAGV